MVDDLLIYTRPSFLSQWFFSTKKMESNLEQHYALRFCFLADFTLTNVYEMLKNAYSDSVISRTAAYRWYSEFKAGRMKMEDLPRSGRPVTMRTNENIVRVAATLNEDCHSSCRSLLEQIGIPKTIIQQILHDCGKIGIFSSCITMLLHITRQKPSIFCPKKLSQSATIRHTARIRVPHPNCFLFSKLKPLTEEIQKDVTQKLKSILESTFAKGMKRLASDTVSK